MAVFELVNWLLSFPQVSLAWTSGVHAGVRTRPGSPGELDEGSRTCPDGKCCRWSGQSRGLRRRKSRGVEWKGPSGPACSLPHFAPAEDLAFYPWAVIPTK